MRLVLPSNSSMNHYPNNTLTKFTVKLPHSLDLSSGQWECGLFEIQFFKSWYNVTDAYIKVKQGNNIYVSHIQDGYYENAECFIDELNQTLDLKIPREIRKCFKIEYNKIKRTCSFITNVHMDLSYSFSPTLTRVLGFENMNINSEIQKREERIPNTQKVMTAFISKQPVRLNSIFNLMVYSDIAQSSIVGDIEAPLLRVVPVNDGHWKYQCTTFSKIQYLPISQKNIQTITVYIYTDFGTPVPFNDGKTIVTLDFRRVKSLHIY